ncbi:MAG: HD domain-containing phosphohydrolase [Nitrospirota bacterium]
MPDKIFDFISCVVTAMSEVSLYSKDHPAIAEISEKAANIIDGLFVEDSFNITLLGKNFMINDTPVIEKGMHIETFRKKLKAKGIEKVIIKKGVLAEEIQRFIYEIALKNMTPSSSEHILVGTVQVRFKSPEADTLAIMSENISLVRNAYDGISRFKKLDIFGLEDAVMGFVSALKSEANVLHVISPVKSYSEYTYVHAANVSTLTIFQAESLSLKGEDLYEAGLAGLLHDIGKLFVSKEVLEKEKGLDGSEWTEMKKHPIHGALYLSTLEEVPKLAVIAAFEHHMKFDGTGYPDTKRRGRKQHLISQLVAISDVFDAMRTERPYQKARELPVIVAVFKEMAGKDFNPVLVDNFLNALKKVGCF